MEFYFMYLLFIIGFLFCLWVFYRIGYNKGYKAGARMVLKEWKEELYLKGDNKQVYLKEDES